MLTPYNGQTNYISQLDDLPNDVGGLTADQLKAMFDKFGTEFVAWFNATHLGEVAGKSQLSNPNLLINPFFQINQRGIGGTISAPGYFLDCWYLVSGSVTILANGIELNGTIKQILENAAGTDAVAAYLALSGTATATYSNTTKTFTLASSGGTIQAAKLELGSVSTLANDVAPKPATDLAECQRYCIVAASGERAVGNTNVNNDTICHCFYSMPQPMRINPTFSASAGDFRVNGNSKRLAPTGISGITATNTGISFNLTIPTGIGTAHAVSVEIPQGMLISAEL